MSACRIVSIGLVFANTLYLAKSRVAYNLGWKLSQVIHGYADPIILKTYQSERRHVAKQLIEFDRKFSKLFSGRPAKDIIDSEGVDLAEFKKAFETGNMFTSGIGKSQSTIEISLIQLTNAVQ